MGPLTDKSQTNMQSMSYKQPYMSHGSPLHNFTSLALQNNTQTQTPPSFQKNQKKILKNNYLNLFFLNKELDNLFGDFFF